VPVLVAEQVVLTNTYFEPCQTLYHCHGDSYGTGVEVGLNLRTALCQTATPPPSASVAPLQYWAESWCSQTVQ
jgi:hypothetical protein